MNDVKSLSHTKWNCKYHIVFAPKYRRKAFYGENSSGLYDWKLVQIKAPSSLFYLADCAPYANVRHPASNVNPGYTNWMDAQGKIHNYNCGMAAGKTHYGLADWHNGFLNGLYELQNNARLYVSRGSGQWGPQMRFLAPSEITVIQLQPQQQGDSK